MGIILLEKHLWLRVEETPEFTVLDVDLRQRVLDFFQKTMFWSARGYEETLEKASGRPPAQSLIRPIEEYRRETEVIEKMRKAQVPIGSKAALENVARSIGSTVGKAERKVRTVGKKVAAKAKGVSKSIKKKVARKKAVKQKAKRLVKRLAGKAKSAVRSARRKKKKVRTVVRKIARA